MLGQRDKRDVVKHFLVENIPRQTIYNTISRWEKGLPCEDKPRSGRPSNLSSEDLKKLKKSTENRVGVSQRKLAKKFSVSQMCISRTLKKLDLKYRKRQRAPKYTEKQLDQIPKKCRKLRRDFADTQTFIIMDDEKYFGFSGHDMPGNAGYYTTDHESTPNDVRFKSKEKFPPKVLVWLALSEKGISQPFVNTVKGPAIDGNTYIKKCLKKLIPFIEKYHQGDQYIFWPDLASSHYAKDTLKWLTDQEIPFVPKEANPPNVPQARPIENFWGILADKVYDGGWEAKSGPQLSRRIKQKIKEIDLSIVQAMMTKVRTKLRKIEDNGPLSIL